MTFKQRFLCLLIGVVIFVTSFNSCSAESNEGHDKRDNSMESIFPFMLLLGGASSVHNPTVWLLGAICLGVMAFMANNFKLKDA